jgi:hypothetical protein
VIDTTIVAAHNEAFAKTGYAASSCKAVADINMPNNDDNVLMINAATMVSAQWWGPNFWVPLFPTMTPSLSDYPILKDLT